MNRAGVVKPRYDLHWGLGHQVILVLMLLLTAVTGNCSDDVALEQLTAAQTRVVWLQDHGATANDVLAAGKQLRLMKLDSRDQRGEIALLPELRNYAKPLITPDGQRVVYSDQVTQKFLVVNWDGSGKRVLGDGFAVDVCRDFTDGTDWVYVTKRVGKPDVAVYRNVRRVKLDDPKVSQKVWDVTDISCDNFQLSADLKHAGSDFPWPHGGVANLTAKTWKKLDQGCWASIAPDNSRLSWVLDGPHRHLQFRRPDQAEGWKVNISGAPAVSGAEIFHPRWSNHVRFLALSGPYQINGPINLISGGGPQVELHLGRFSPDFRSVEAWHQLTKNSVADFYPDVWIEGGEAAMIELPGLKQTAPQTAQEWPAITQDLMFAWSNGAASNQLPPASKRPGSPCQVTAHGPAILGRYFELRPRGGHFTLDGMEPLIRKTLESAGTLSLEVLITPEEDAATPASFLEIGTVGNPSLVLSQHQGHLSWRVGLSQGECNVPAWQKIDGSTRGAVHVTCTLTRQKIELFLDGKLVDSSSLMAGVLKLHSGEIRFGGQSWRGHMEAIGITDRVLLPGEIFRQATAARRRLIGRKSIDQVKLQVKCIEPSGLPAPRQILPYRRALALDVCEVLSVERIDATNATGNQIQSKKITSGSEEVSAQVKPGDRILVARWVILDGQTIPKAEFKVGATAAWTVEAMSEHPELNSERQVVDTIEVDLPTWYVPD